MEPTKISSINELDLTAAQKATTAILSLLDGLAFAAPEDTEGAVVRLKTIASKLTDIAAALKIAPPRASTASDAPVIHDLQQRIQTLEGTARRHRDQRGAILEALGGVTWEQAVPRARELVSLTKIAEQELASIEREVPPHEPAVPLAQRVAQLVREHREMAEEMAKGADPVDVLEAAQRISDVCEGCGGALCERCNGCHGNGPNDPLVGACPQQVRICPRKQKDIADEVSRQAPPPRDDEPPVELEDVAIAGTLSALAAVIATSALNWERYPCLAWVYGVLVGHGVDTLDELQQAFGWRDGTVEEIEGHRRVLLAARGIDVL